MQRRTALIIVLVIACVAGCGDAPPGEGPKLPWAKNPATEGTGTSSAKAPEGPAKPPVEPVKPPVEPVKPPVEPEKPPVRPPAPPATRGKLTLEDVRALLELGVDEGEVVLAVRGAKSVALTEADLATLRGLGAGERVLAEVSKRIASGPARNPLDAVLAMLGDRPPEEILDWVLRQGRPVKLSADDILKLRQAGAGRDVIEALQGRYVPEGFKVYRDPLRLVSVHYPAAWNTYEWFRDEVLWVLLSPERDVPEPNHFRTGLQIQISSVGESSLVERVGVVEYHRRSLPAVLRGNRKYDLAVASGPDGEIRPFAMAGREAVVQHFTAKMLGTECRDKMARLVADGVDFFFEFIAPEDRYAELAPTFERMLSTARPFPERVDLVRRDEPLDRTEILERYRESVVMVLSQWPSKGLTGFGTGFFVREDGLLLTNHHVVDHEGAAPERIEIVWDRSVGPKKPGEKNRRMEAFLVDRIMAEWPLTDLALLRVPKGAEPFKVLPLLTLRSGLVKPEDEVIALGFPVPTAMRQVGELITTNGHLSRINTMPGAVSQEVTTAALDDAVVDITINQGNSGGPCVHLRTGGVIGLNTRIVLAAGIVGAQAQKLEYGRVCLADHALRIFPQLRWYPKDRSLRPVEHVELAAILMSRGNHRAAESELRLAEQGEAELDAAQRARLWQLRSRHAAETGQQEAAGEYLLRALDADPKNVSTLSDLAIRNAAPAVFDRAASYLHRLIQLRPDSFSTYFTAAEVYRLAGRRREALSSVKRAIDLGGGYDPAVHRLKAFVHQEAGELDAAAAAYEDALAADPADWLAKVSLGNLFAGKGDLAAAQSWYARALAEDPDEPLVRQGYGDLLAREDVGREGDAAEQYAAALRLHEEKGTIPPASLLEAVAVLGIERNTAGDEELRGRALAASLLLYRNHPLARGAAHRFLTHYWEGRGAPDLATAHRAAGDPELGTTLTLDEVSATVEAGYPPELLEDLFTATSVNFPLNDKFQQAFQSDSWVQAHIDAVVRRDVRDMVEGSAPLARDLLTVEPEGYLLMTGEGPHGVWEITNNGEVPITSVMLRFDYEDPDGNVVWGGEKPLASAFLPLLPGESERAMLLYHSFEELAAHGLTAENIHRITTTRIRARNAFFLAGVTVEGGYKPEGYVFTIANRGEFILRSPRVLCFFVREDGTRIVNPARSDTPVTEARAFEGVEIAPGTSSVELTVSDWSDRAYLTERLGLPEAEIAGASIRVIVFDAEARVP
ncbi:MAG: tetratricopeptide repeat-containing serine protease family protein [Planctomycetes bacterium]|nr:tetratricopeptide repeat-containing serine protease family protein [Planctomycetota bacterium]